MSELNKNEHVDQEEEEYDELDDLLDEDPSKLDEEGFEEEGKNSQLPSTSGPKEGTRQLDNEDPEVKEMMNELQKEFESMMKEEGDGNKDVEQAENFQQVLQMLGEASKTSSNIAGPAAEGEPQGFKNVVSKTLDRLKENGTKVDSNLAKEEKQKNPDDVLSQLLDQLVENGNGEGEEGMDNAILNILNQMASKEVLYQPMKEMNVEFTEWLHDHQDDEEHKDKIDTYKKQYGIVGKIVNIYESDTYTNEAYREEITNLLDELEQLGDSPVSKGFNKNGNGNIGSKDDSDNNELNDIAKMLEIDGDDKNLGNLDKELADTCKQQ